MSSAEKARRQRAILDLVRSRAITDQQELVRILSGRGHSVTQSTLSRDLKEMRIFRVPIAGGYRYLPAGDEAIAPAAGPGLPRISTAEVVAVDGNETVAVVRTQVGRAQGVAVYLDGLRLAEALATVAGDDTILVIPTSSRKTAALIRRLRSLFGLA